MKTQLEGLAKVLAQTTALQTILGAVDAAAVLADHTFFGTSQDEVSLPDNYAVYTLVSESGYQVLSLRGDCVTKTPRIEMTLYLSDFGGSPTPQAAYLIAIGFYEDLMDELIAGFLTGTPVYASDGTGRISLTELIFDQDSMELGERASDGEYLTLSLLFIMSPE
jgi:hypothetical protein